MRSGINSPKKSLLKIPYGMMESANVMICLTSNIFPIPVKSFVQKPESGKDHSGRFILAKPQTGVDSDTVYRFNSSACTSETGYLLHSARDMPFCVPQLESREPPTISFHVENFRIMPNPYRKRTVVARSADLIWLPLHIDDTPHFVWSVLVEGAFRTCSEDLRMEQY
jgi:hypothetical protein